MHLYPKDIIKSLEFDKVLALVSEYCVGEPGQELARELRPSKDIETIKRWLHETAEYKLSLEQNDPFPVRSYTAIGQDLYQLKIPGYVLSVESLQRIHNVLSFIRRAFKFFSKARQATYPHLYAIIQPLVFEKDLIKAIDLVVDKEGEIRPDASPALLKIRRLIGSKQGELDRKFRLIVNDYRKKGWLADTVESIRNGRRVICVLSENKRKIKGIIHDESTTGKTSFIEPDGVIDVNNELFELEIEYKREIYRILKELSETLRPYVPHFYEYESTIARFDLVQAKGQMALSMGADMPQLQDDPNINLLKAYHPLLFLKNKAEGKKTVPFNLIFKKPNRILLLSGPNAGGKSISMKTVGLLQLMLQAGMLVTANPESQMGVFNSGFADIGDQQSIEDDLSTYSSRLANARVFLEEADEKSIIFIDEFGSGTDPKIGGAIAEAILRELNFKKVHGFITTHYSNLKTFAFKSKGIVNAAMIFDKETLSPTYQMKVGRPGSSYGYEIAQNAGLPNKVLKYARMRGGKNEKAVDELLVDLQQEKKEVEEKLFKLEQQQSALAKLIVNYDNLHNDLEYKRKKFKLESKEIALQQTARENKDLEKLVREIKEKQNLEKAKQLSLQAKSKRQELVSEVQTLKEDIYYKSETVVPPTKLEEGVFVKLKTGSATGQIESIQGKKAILSMGGMRVTVNLRDLQPVAEPLDVRKGKSVQSNHATANHGFESQLDIRGMRMEEANQVIESYLDQALMANTPVVRILHGKGTGVLKQLVKHKVREYRNIDTKVYHPEHKEGGDGITIIEFL